MFEIVRQNTGALPIDGDPEGAKTASQYDDSDGGETWEQDREAGGRPGQFDARLDSRIYANRAKLHRANLPTFNRHRYRMRQERHGLRVHRTTKAQPDPGNASIQEEVHAILRTAFQNQIL